MKSVDKTISLKLTEIVEDQTIYPRAQVDQMHVGHLVEVFRAKVDVPNIIVDRRSKRLIDGMHRKRALEVVLGSDSRVTVTSRRYSSDAEMFRDAMFLNSGHGQNLSAYDRKIAIQRAVTLQMTPREIASALRMTVEQVGEIHRVIISPHDIKPTNPFGIHHDDITGKANPVPLKMPIRHMAGHQLSSEQVSAIPSLGGNQQVFYINQLITLIKTGMIDLNSKGVVSGLDCLKKLLNAL